MTEQHVASAIAEEEPKTPMWLPALGAALFVGIALWWAVTPSAPPAAAEAAASAAASASAAAPNPQAQPAQPAQPGTAAMAGTQPGRMPMPSALPPELQKRLDEMRRKHH